MKKKIVKLSDLKKMKKEIKKEDRKEDVKMFVKKKKHKGNPY